MAAWVGLVELKADLGIVDDRDDVLLAAQLDAAAVFVARLRPDIDYRGAVPADVVLGTIRLAGRWFTRRRSPDALVALGELGSSRVPSFDPDIERLLKIGRYRSPVLA